MKAHTGLFELVIIVVFIIGATPLLMSLVLTCNKSKFNYLDDKTVYEMNDTVEYVYDAVTRSYVPINLSPISLDYGGAQLISLLQDDYCPDSGKSIAFKLTASHPDGTDDSGNAVIPVSTINITRGWYTKRTDAFSTLHNTVSGHLKSVGVDGPFYLVWDYKNNTWMITHEFVNIFEEK